MSLDNAWTIEEMGHAMRAERMADAERFRLIAAVTAPKPGLRVALAQALRSLATLVDGEINTRAQPERPLARAARAI